jgi:hypothetical protein
MEGKRITGRDIHFKVQNVELTEERSSCDALLLQKIWQQSRMADSVGFL